MALLLPGLLSLTLVPAAFADTEVTPTEPTATTPTCDNPDVTVTPDSQGGQIIWNPEGPTTITPGYQVDYAATPAPGVVFPDGSWTWSFPDTFDTSTCPPPTPPPPPTGPTTQADNLAYYWESKFYTTLPVTRNDTPPDGQTLTVVDATKSSSSDSPVRILNGQLQIKLCACDDGKTLTLQYKAGAGDYVSDWTTVTVKVKHVRMITSHRKHHHKAKFVNRNPFPVKVEIRWRLTYRHHRNQWFRIPANSSKLVRRDRHGESILWSAFRKPHHWRTPVSNGFM